MGSAARAGFEHHALAVHEALLAQRTDPDRGLEDAEAAARLARFGPNRLPEINDGGALSRLLRQFQNPLVLVLLAAFAVTAALGEYVDAAVIIGVVLVNAAIGYLQEAKAQSALDALRRMTTTQAVVRRSGVVARIPSESLVPGDVVQLEAGDKIPADLRLLSGTGLQADESALTGESYPVAKDESVLPPATPVADRRNMLYAGTLVVGGTGAGLVVATGSHTELGEIHRLVGEVDPLATPLTRRLASFSRVLTVIILGLAVLTFGIGVLRGESWSEMFLAAVALAVGAIPEGLPAAVTITLAIGMARMARRRAIIRRLPAVETLGSTTVICSDKTGTLTLNRMTVRQVVPASEIAGGGQSPAPQDDRAAYWTLVGGVLCNDASVGPDGTAVGDPTETALLTGAVDRAWDPAALRSQFPRLDAVPFASEHRWMATLHRTPTGSILCVKGAVEAVLERCVAAVGTDGRPAPLDPDAVVAEVERLAAAGLRVLAFAIRPSDVATTSLEPADVAGLLFAGLQAMADPPRPEAITAVASCQSAGMEVRMITGDHPVTAVAIARELGIWRGDAAVMTGAELAATPAGQLADRIGPVAVFARVSPEQKLLLVEALQSRGQVVAMTGDGVNDAPALRQADIGIAMGLIGTEVAKEAADMVLTDDDFATIEAAVEEGRGVFDNLTKFIAWTLPTNMGEGFVILVAILLGTQLPILPVQILWINMTTAVLLGLTLAFEPKEPGIMSRPPIEQRRPLLDRDLVIRIGLVSAVLVAGSWWLFQWELATGAPVEEARTAAVNVFVVVEAVYLFFCRTLHGPARRVGWFSNRWLLIGVASQLALQAAITYLPAMHTLFGTAPLDAATWLRIGLVGLIAAVVVGLDKRLRPPSRRWEGGTVESAESVPTAA